MSQTLLTFQLPVIGPDRTEYEARACGRESTGGMWEGWIEFLPLDGGEPVRSSRETTQPNRVDTEYWATGLTPVYLEGAIRRALAGPPRAARVAGPAPSIFSEPAPSLAPHDVEPQGVLDPFAAYHKGEAPLRK